MPWDEYIDEEWRNPWDGKNVNDNSGERLITNEFNSNIALQFYMKHGRFPIDMEKVIRPNEL